MRNSRKILSIGLGVLIGALVTGCAVAPSTGAGATSRGTASSGAAGSSFEQGSDPVTQTSAGAEPAGGGSDDSTGITSGAGGGAVRPTGSDDASVSSDDAVGGSVTTLADGVDGKVSDQEGIPVTGALVTPTSLDTPSKAIPEVAVFTDDEGRYSWVLPPGRYRITVTADGYQEASVETEVPEGGTATLDLQLRKA